MNRHQLVLLKSIRTAHGIVSRNRHRWEPHPELADACETLRTGIRRLGESLPLTSGGPGPEADAALSGLINLLQDRIDPLVATVALDDPELHETYLQIRRVAIPAGSRTIIPGSPDEDVSPDALRFEAELIREETSPARPAPLYRKASPVLARAAEALDARSREEESAGLSA